MGRVRHSQMILFSEICISVRVVGDHVYQCVCIQVAP